MSEDRMEIAQAEHYEYTLKGAQQRIEELSAQLAAAEQERDEARNKLVNAAFNSDYLRKELESARLAVAMAVEDAAKVCERETFFALARIIRGTLTPADYLAKAREAMRDAERLRAALVNIEQNTRPDGQWADRPVNEFAAAALAQGGGA